MNNLIEQKEFNLELLIIDINNNFTLTHKEVSFTPNSELVPLPSSWYRRLMFKYLGQYSQYIGNSAKLLPIHKLILDTSDLTGSTNLDEYVPKYSFLQIIPNNRFLNIFVFNRLNLTRSNILPNEVYKYIKKEKKELLTNLCFIYNNEDIDTAYSNYAQFNINKGSRLHKVLKSLNNIQDPVKGYMFETQNKKNLKSNYYFYNTYKNSIIDSLDAKTYNALNIRDDISIFKDVNQFIKRVIF